MQELRAARALALQSNPDLVANGKAIANQMRALEDKLDAAMTKSDPAVVPILAKFQAGSQHPGAPGAPAPPPPAK
jgi:hypothetical protein